MRVPLAAALAVAAMFNVAAESNVAVDLRSTAAALSAAASSACHSTFYPRVGSDADATIVPHGPGLVLMGGGTDVDAAFRWVQRTIAGTATRSGGDLVVLRAYGDNDYDRYIYGLARFNSVRTIVLPPCAGPTEIARAAAVVDRAQAVFFSGGDQANYVRWKGTPLIAAVQHLYDRGGVVGGTSAGLAILGEYVFDAVAGDRTHDVHTRDAVADPYEEAISFTTGLLRFPILGGTITDTHFKARDRLGRLAVFMARLVADDPPGRGIKAIGVDARSAVVVDALGNATLLLQGAGGRALFLSGRAARRMVRGRPLLSSPIESIVLDRRGARFDLRRWCGDGRKYSIIVDGSAKPIYEPPNPYVAPRWSVPATCSGAY